MKKVRVIFFISTLALALSGCGIFGGSDGTDLSVAEELTPQPSVNVVQAVPADPDTEGDAQATTEAGAALPTAIALPTAAPTPEPTVDRSQPTTYIVQSGDVLGLIAERFDVDIAELRRVNGLDGNLIRVGQELTIPALEGSTESAAGDESPTSAPASGSSGSSGSGSSSAPVTCNSAATGHCIQPGESLLGIALKYDVSVDDLRAANPGISGDLIRSGEVLNLPGGAPSATSAPVATTVPGSTAGPVPTVGPANDADCKARNPDFPFYHAADGLCYANPIGSTTVPTSTGATDDDCPAGTFLWEDGLCYPIPGATVTPDATAAAATASAQPATPTSTTPTFVYDPNNYGRPPCDAWEVILISTNKCWPEDTATEAQKEEGRVKAITPVAG